jgi:hypothetical protein
MKSLGDVYTKFHDESFTTLAICQDCAATLFGELRLDQAEIFLEKLPEPVVVVDRDGVVMTANNLARVQLGKGLHNIMGFTVGRIIECEHANKPEGCGKTIHCNGCTIRMCVEDTYNTGRSNINVPAYGEALGDAGPNPRQRQLLTISTERVADVVVLRIVDISSNRDSVPEATS